MSSEQHTRWTGPTPNGTWHGTGTVILVSAKMEMPSSSAEADLLTEAGASVAAQEPQLSGVVSGA